MTQDPIASSLSSSPFSRLPHSLLSPSPAFSSNFTPAPPKTRRRIKLFFSGFSHAGSPFQSCFSSREPPRGFPRDPDKGHVVPFVTQRRDLIPFRDLFLHRRTSSLLRLQWREKISMRFQIRRFPSTSRSSLACRTLLPSVE